MNSSRHIVSAGQENRRLAEIGETPVASVDRVDLSDSVSFFRRRLGLILSVIALALVVGAVISFISPKVYTASATVALEPPAQEIGSTTPGAVAPAPNSSFVDTQVEIIASREMATRVAQSLGMLEGLTAADRRDVIDSMIDNIGAVRSGESYALLIRYYGATGQDAASVVNEYAQQFVDWELNSTRDRTRDSIETIQERLAELREQAQADTAALQQYRIANNLLSTSGASLTEQEISSYNQAVTSARAQAAEDQARLNTALQQLRSGSTGDDVGEALGSAVIGSLRGREAELAGRIANLQTRYGPNYPELIRTRNELTEIREQIDTEIKRIVSNLQANLAVSEQRLTSLSGSLNRARGQLSRNNAAMVGLDELERNAEISQGLYETYLNSYKQLVAGEGTERANARILTLAEVPFLPTSPNILLNMLLAAAIGLGLGLLAAFLAEAFFKGIRGPEDLQRFTGERYLGAIPLLASVSKTQKREVTAIGNEPRSAFAEAFRSLRTSIEQVASGPTKVVAITSSLPKEGKTVTSVCLAQTLAMSGAKTLLIDCDEAKRGVSRLLDLSDGHPGVIEVLEGTSTLEDAIIDSEAGLSILPIQHVDEPQQALFTGPEMAELLDRLRDQYDYIIMDLPPIIPVAISRKLAGIADATVMVVRWRKTAAAALQSALNQMPPDRINVIGITMTQVDLRKQRLLGRNDPSFYYRHGREYYS